MLALVAASDVVKKSGVSSLVALDPPLVDRDQIR